MFLIELRPSFANSTDHQLSCLMKHFGQEERVNANLCIVPRAKDHIQYRGQTLLVHSVCLYCDTSHGDVVAHAYVSIV